MVPDASQGAILLSNLLSNPAQQDPSKVAWQALADAAKALLAIANAQLGKDVSSLQTPTLQHVATLPCHPDDSPRLCDAINTLLTVKAKGARSDRYLEQLQYTLSAFSKHRSRRSIGSFTTDELEKWLDDMGGAARTRKGRILYLRLLFLFAKKRGWIAQNPAEALELPQKDPQKIGIHTPAQVKAVLAEALRQNASMARVLAIRYFAGLRTAELNRLTDENVKADRGFIEVPACAAKTRRRRLVKIQPNLAEWLKVAPKLPEMAAPTMFGWVQELAEAANVPWPNNVTRHSFVSYHIAMFENAAKTALEAGHAEQVLFNNYREVVTPDSAKKYWAIVP